MQTLDADEANALVKDRDTIHRVYILTEGDDGHSWYWVQSSFPEAEGEAHTVSFVNVSTDNSGTALNSWLSLLEVSENNISLTFGGTQSVYQFLWVNNDGTWTLFDD